MYTNLLRRFELFVICSRKYVHFKTNPFIAPEKLHSRAENVYIACMYFIKAYLFYEYSPKVWHTYHEDTIIMWNS